MVARLFAVIAFAGLSACGADGPPEAPASKAAAATSLTISGCAKVGVTMGPKSNGPTRC